MGGSLGQVSSSLCQLVGAKPVQSNGDTVTVEFRAETVEFRAGGTAACVGAWREITSDPFVIEGVTGTRVDVNTLLVLPDLPRSY